MNRFVRYWCQLMIRIMGTLFIKKIILANKVVIIALMSALAMFQAAGNLIPGIGLFISPFATLPIFWRFATLFVREYFLISLLFSYYLLLSQVS